MKTNKFGHNLSSGRIEIFDLLRGYFLFVIIIDHLTRYFGFWEIFTGRGAQWVSAAEGFFFVSGIMIGLVRGKRMQKFKLKEVITKCWRRAATLYFWGVGLSLTFSSIAIVLKDSPGLKQPIFVGSNFDLVLQTLTFRFNYGWADFLGYYSVYIFIAPLAIWLLRKNLWHSVLLLSLVVWSQTTTIMGSWQLLFFGGVVAGFHIDEIRSYALSLSLKTRKMFAGTIYFLAGLSLATSVFFTTIAEEYGSGSNLFLASAKDYSAEVLRPIFEKSSLAPMRIVLFAIWFSALFLLFKKFEVSIKRYAGWLLISFGKNSLYVYIVHAIIVFFLDVAIPGNLHWTLNIVTNTSVVLLIWLMVKRRIFFNVIPR